MKIAIAKRIELEGRNKLEENKLTQIQLTQMIREKGLKIEFKNLEIN